MSRSVEPAFILLNISEHIKHNSWLFSFSELSACKYSTLKPRKKPFVTEEHSCGLHFLQNYMAILKRDGTNMTHGMTQP